MFCRLVLAAMLLVGTVQEVCAHELSPKEVREAFRAESIFLVDGEVARVLPAIRRAHHDYCETAAQGMNSKVRFAAIEVARELGFDPGRDQSIGDRVTRIIARVRCPVETQPRRCGRMPRCEQRLSWQEYFRRTIGLVADARFLAIVQGRGFSPVTISWEDIGRYQNSAWGDRISDVGIWVREHERDPNSAQLALSVRRDSNFRDKVLMVPAEHIKVHSKVDGEYRETTLPERLRELGLASESRDRHVIVSNQFSIVPVPLPGMSVDRSRSAFTFSIFPYGSTNFVITDVIEGSHEAIVGPGGHQLLYANVHGQKAPFTASRASDRRDLLALEHDLKQRGMDVDVQRYYLIQVPLKRSATGVVLSQLGVPPLHPLAWPAVAEAAPGAPIALKAMEGSADEGLYRSRSTVPGLEKVAIGTGEPEGPYHTGSGFRGQRAEEPIRVTVVYFVTPSREVSEADMDQFARTFAAWDEKAIWGGSFVLPPQ